MSILIRGMEMPTNCEDCPMCHSNAEYDYAYCCVSSAETSGIKIPSNCPLVSIPTHGRLIDADAFLALINDSTILSDFLKCIINPLIRGEPTVIEAEGGE